MSSQKELYTTVFSLPVTGTHTEKPLSLASRAKNRLQYRQEIMTLAQRKNWVRKNIPNEMVPLWLKKVEREHCLQLRELYPSKKKLIAKYLSTMSKQVIESMPGTVLD
jgi:hypothetical protein